MKLGDLFGQKECVFALEVFPPKRESGIEAMVATLQKMAEVRPDYISVTYSAGGGGDTRYTAQIAAYIKQQLGIEPLAHLTCVNNGKNDVLSELDRLHKVGIKNILALRGDKTPGVEPCGDYAFASDLMLDIREQGGFYVAGACYPEGHPDSATLAVDMDGLKAKQNAGVGHLVSQLFFDNGKFFRFLNLARKKGINCPIEAGVMPIVRKEQIERTIALSSASLPAEFSKMVTKYADDTDAFFDAGIEYAVRQIRDLIEGGVDGIHLYAMNNTEVALRVREGLDDLL